MYALIAQGPGYYGVNVKIISDDEAQRIHDKFDYAGGEFPGNTMADDGTMIMLVPVEEGKSFGFDTGWAEEGDKAIAEVTC